MRTAREWNCAALARLRMVHLPTGKAGNLVAHGRGKATLFLRFESIGAPRQPVFERFSKAELAPESGVAS